MPKLSAEEEQKRQHMREHLYQEALLEPMDYFSHDTDALSDDALFELFESQGFAGLGMFWTLIQLLTRKRGHAYRGYRQLAHEMYLTESECAAFCEVLADLGLLDAEAFKNGSIVSRRVMRNAETYADKISRSRLGAALTNRRA